VHSDSQSDGLNQTIQARAFTTGQDIFFRQGEYNPGSSRGQELLAHELTHVVQQNGELPQTKRDGESNRIQRMAFRGTNWESATSARMSSGGGGGAIIIQDKKNQPIVVKASEESPGEAVLFAQIFGGAMAGGSKKSDKWELEAPDVRMADAAESRRIKGVLDRLLPDSEDDRRIARAKAALLDGSSPTVIYTYAKGKDFGRFWYKAKTGTKGPKTKDRLKIVSQLWQGPGMMTLLGMVHMGKRKNRLTLIDNVFDAPGQGGKFETKQDFDQWVAARHYSEELQDFSNVTQDFKGDNFVNLARVAFGMIFDEVRYSSSGLGEVGDRVSEGLDGNKDKMIAWFAAGLAEAKGRMMIAVQNAERAIGAGGLDLGNKQHQILRHLKARKLFLAGASAAEAWRMSSSWVRGRY
jgi:hypothetical protein